MEKDCFINFNVSYEDDSEEDASRLCFKPEKVVPRNCRVDLTSPIKVILADICVFDDVGDFFYLRNDEEMKDQACIFDKNDSDMIDEAYKQASSGDAKVFISSRIPSSLNDKTLAIALKEEEVTQLGEKCKKGMHVTVKMLGKSKDENIAPDEKFMFMRVVYHSHDDKKSKRPPYDALKNCAIVKVLLPEKDMDIPRMCEVVYPAFHEEKKIPTSFKDENEVNGKACLCMRSDIHYINKVIQLSATKPKVLFVRFDPTVALKVPTIVIGELDILQKLTSSYKKCFVYFSEEPFEKKTTTLRSRKKSKTQDSGGLFSWALSQLTGRQSISSSKLAPLLEKRFATTDVDYADSEFYEDAIEVLKDIDDSDHQESEVEEAVKLFKENIDQKGLCQNMYLLSLCCFLCDISNNSNTSDDSFISSILKAIQNLRIESPSEILRDYQSPEEWIHPCKAIVTILEYVIEARLSSPCLVDSCVTRILWILSYHCGKYSDGFWPSLCHVVTPKYAEKESTELSKFLPEKSRFTIELLLQNDLVEICDTIYEHNLHNDGDDEAIVLHSGFYDIILEVISKLSIIGGENLPKLFNKFQQTLPLFSFANNNDLSKRNLVNNLLKQLSYSKQRTFDVITKCFEFLRVDYTSYEMVKNCFFVCIQREFKTDPKIPVKDTTDLLLSKLGKNFVRTTIGRDIIWNYFLEREERLSTKTNHKLKFYSCIFRLYICEGNLNDPKKYALYILNKVTHTANQICLSTKRINLLLAFSREDPDFLYCDPKVLQYDPVQHIINECFNLKLDFQKPNYMRLIKTVLQDKDQPPHSLYSRFQQKISYSLLYSVQIHNAIFLFKDFMEEESVFFLSLADEIITSFYNRWSPKCITDLLKLGSDELFELLYCLQFRKDSVSDSKIRIQRKGCFENITKILSNWIQNYHDGEVDYHSVFLFLMALRKDRQKWNILNCQLPKDEEFVSTLKKFNSVQTQIHSSITLCSSAPSIYELLSKHNLTLDENHDIDNVLLKYKNYFEQFEKMEPTEFGFGDVSLKSLQADASKLNDFREQHNRELSVVEYFFSRKSILFQAELEKSSSSSTCFLPFLKEIENTVGKINSLFSENATYKMIQSTTKAIKLEGSNVPEELEILRKCPNVIVPVNFEEIYEETDCLASVFEPLLMFSRFCEQFSFSVINDVEYKELKDILDAMRNESLDDWSVTRCIETYRLISRLLYSGKETDIETSRNVLKVFSVISTCGEVWRFADEKSWFGKDGLNNFYKEYKNVTDSRAGLGENSYEMKVLDSFGPAIRCVSAVGALKDCTKLSHLLMAVQSNIDLSEVESGNKFTDILTSQKNILKIREWFTEGMDDVAGILNKFEFVMESGKFFLSMDRSDKESFDSPLSLSLTYQVETKEQLMSTKDIEDFVNKLGFIQHDDDAVRNFITKYHVVSRALKLLVLMDQVGYIDVSCSNFQYETKTDVSVIKRDLTQYNVMKNECDSWLDKIREKYPVSLLFWMEELRKMDSLHRESTRCAESKQLLQQMLSRVLSINATKQESYDEVEHAMEQLRFEECEKEISPILNEINTVVEQDDQEKLILLFRNLKSKLNIITNAYMENSDMSDIIKKVSKKYKSSSSDVVEIVKECRSELKTRYQNGSVPEGFKPNKTKVPFIQAQDSDLEMTKVTCWLERISNFIQKLYKNIHKNNSGRSLHKTSNPLSQITIHNITSRVAIINLIGHIYTNRLPREFEVLDGNLSLSNERISIFLQRAERFPSSIFTILNTQDLSSEHQELITEFLTNQDISSKSINIHFIQTHSTLLYSSPWVKENFWSDEVFTRDCKNSIMRDLVVDHKFLDEVMVIYSLSSCSGKTSFIRRMMDNTELPRETSTINIHEGTTLTSLVQLLHKKFSYSPKTRAVHFSFTFDLNEKQSPTIKRLLLTLNHFFLSFLYLRNVYDPVSKDSFSVGKMRWKIFVELPYMPPDQNVETKFGPKEWLSQNLPALSSCCLFKEPPNETIVDEHMRRVAIYLRAFENGTIDRKFQKKSKRIVFVLDKSYSMSEYVGMDTSGNQVSCMDVAVENTLKIFDSHLFVNDYVSLVMFNNQCSSIIELQQIKDDRHKNTLRERIDSVRNSASGGTRLYGALRSVLSSLAQGNSPNIEETWIICLTDGESQDSSDLIKKELQESSDDLHIVIIGVNLNARLHQEMTDVTKKYGESSATKGFFLPTAAQLSTIDDAFSQVAASIPVSQTFELDGILNDAECVDYIRNHVPDFVPEHDKLLQKFFVEFMYRRVKVFDENKDFNFNEKHERLGSSLMEIMLKEVEQFLVTEQNKDWHACNHHQLIYDFSKESPEFRLICTSPDLIESEIRKKLESLELQGFHIPSRAELQRIKTLYKYLSQALNIPLDILEDQIKNNKFVLTLDFCMKLLSIHERISCSVPCVIEGETGVSKTALTSMYSKLINSSLYSRAKESTEEVLSYIEKNLKDNHLPNEENNDNNPNVLLLENQLSHQAKEYDMNNPCVEVRIRSLMQHSDLIHEKLHGLLTHACKEREPIFSNPPEQFLDTSNLSMELVSNFLTWFSECKLEPTFFKVDVHASLTEEDVLSFFEEVQIVARRLIHTKTLIIVFLDEVNTSSIMGLFKEIIIDHSICGDRLEENIVVVAACNPPRVRSTTQGGVFRENDLGKDWASGHYQVNHLPQSICNLKWDFGSLDSKKEKEFVYRRMEIIGDGMPSFMKKSLTELISASQEAIRSFARKHIHERLLRLNPHDESNAEEARLRSRSVVSLRDIQRVFFLFQFFFDLSITLSKEEQKKRKYRHAMLLTIAVVYYLRLSSESRKEFLEKIKSLTTERQEKETFMNVLSDALDKVVKMSEIPPGIALTRGFKENVFMTLVCSLSRTPLMIIGPPGCSKTLSVNTVTDNANGQESMKEFYRELPRLQAFHYQCSKASTSTEVESIFKLAIQRQEKADPKKQLCMIFMDEAGLPEEEKESLKVLHYYLTDAKVGFVGISNHVLDAAKSNRCVTLLRPEPDAEELSCVSKGVLFDFTEQECNQQYVLVDEKVFSADEFSMHLCNAYSDLLKAKWFQTFFGLRDFIYFLKCVKRGSTISGRKMTVTSKLLLQALERNFSGINVSLFVELAHRFLKNVSGKVLKNRNSIHHMCRHPMSVVEEALTLTKQSEGLSQERYKLIIDQTEDDSIMRLLILSGCLKISQRHHFKLSQMPENHHLEKLSLISGVKFAALQGNSAVLSQTESINESFYDLFNLHFRCIKNRNGQVSYYANIAVGSLSRPSLIDPNFRCVVHIPESDLDQTPIPFLNRFEKYTLSVNSVLGHCLRDLVGLSEIVGSSMDQILEFKTQLGDKGICGWREEQTLESIFVHIFGDKMQKIRSTNTSEITRGNLCLCGHLMDFLTQFTAMNLTLEYIKLVIEMGIKYLPHEHSDILQQLSDSGEDIDHARISDTLKSAVESTSQSTSLETVVKIILQMIFTRYAIISFLLKVSCPETIFQNRNNLPEDIITEYFNDDHFNLKQHLQQIHQGDKSLNHIVYTRTDSIIRSLPSWSYEGMSDTGTQKYKMIKQLVHNTPETVCIEHLCMLRSETALHSAIDSWLNDESKSLFLLIIDMNEPNSISMANFVRSFMDNISSNDKSMVLLLHFSPSSNCSYPTLFLGNWSYFFLDGVGSDSSLNVKPWIRAACSTREENNVVDDITSSLHVMLPRCLINLASKNNFSDYLSTQDSLKDRLTNCKKLLKYDLGHETIESLLCKKFWSFCTDEILSNIFSKLSNGLITGTSHLSISTAVSTILQDTFNNFLTYHMKELNDSFTTHILLDSSIGSCNETKKLCAIILQSIPVPPFQELVVLCMNGAKTHSNPSHKTQGQDISSATFPFFHFFSSFLDESVEKLDADLHSDQAENKNISGKKVDVQILTEMLSSTTSPGDISRKDVTKKVVGFITECGCDEKESLFMRYLEQYLFWNFGCKSLSIILPWMMNRLKDMWKSDISLKWNILCIHIICKYDQMDLIQLSSWTHADSFHLLEEVLLEGSNFSEVCLEVKSGEDHLKRMIEHFAKSFIVDNTHYVKNFSDFFQRLPGILENKRLNNPKVLGQLRVLSFQFILKKCNASERVLEETIKRYYNTEKEKMNEKVCQVPHESCLRVFMDIIELDDDNSWKREMCFQLFKLFFSPTYLNSSSYHEYGDLDFLCSFINSTKNSENNLERITTISLRNICMYSESGPKEDSSQSIQQTLQSIAGVVKDHSKDVPEILGRKNFLPMWLCGDIANMEENSSSEEEEPIGQYLRRGYMSIQEPILAAVYEIILSGLAVDVQTRSLTSEDILLKMESEIDNLNLSECDLFQNMVVSASIICFVTKVAQELSFKNDTEVLAGVYGEEGSKVLKLIFNGGSSWLVLLFSTMLRLKGEGYVYSNKKNFDVIAELVNIKDWLNGVPSNADGLIQQLQGANQDLQEATDDEMRKAREFRLCPGCNQEFAVASMNCGDFTCGRLDEHNPSGDDMNLGCGYQFSYKEAKSYVVDKEKLSQLKNKVDCLQKKLNKNKENSLLWSKAKQLRVPMLLLNTKHHEESVNSFLPSSSLIQYVEMKRSENEQGTKAYKNCGFIKHVVDNMGHIEHFKGLERMIELYLWLHLNLKFLLSREQAYQYKMGDLMTEEILLKRFDDSRVHHIMQMWTDVCVSVATFLKEQNHVVYWDCEEVKVPFSSLEDAKLVMLLSEGAHPADGNDYLFLIMNNIAEKYNFLIGKLNENSINGGSLACNAGEAKEIDPKLLVDCRRGNLLSLFNVDLPGTIQNLAESFWLPNKNEYDIGNLAHQLQSEIGMTPTLPEIKNLTSNLREQFRFRNSIFMDKNSDHLNGNITSIAFKSSTGDFFVRRHDFELFENVKQLLCECGLSEGNPEIRKTIHMRFHSLCYSSLREILEGVRTVFDMVSSINETLQQKGELFTTIEQAIIDRSSDDVGPWSSTHEVLKKVGFPMSLDNAQYEMLGRFSPNDIFEMTLYCGRQLARESFSFREKPTRFKEPLSDDHSSQLKRSIVIAIQERGEHKVASELDEFVNDVLKYYEAHLLSPQNRASQNQQYTKKSLREYLKENNCCDESDPIFNILPEEISISNYVGLRLELYQLRLFVLSHKSASLNNTSNDVDMLDSEENLTEVDKSFYSKPVRGSFWLWGGDKDLTHIEKDNSSHFDRNIRDGYRYRFLSDVFWFERLTPNKNQIGGSAVEEPQEDEEEEEMVDFSDVGTFPNENSNNMNELRYRNAAAEVIQKLWRSRTRSRMNKRKKISPLIYSAKKSDHMERHTRGKGKRSRADLNSSSQASSTVSEEPPRKKLKYIPSFVENVYNFTKSSFAQIFSNFQKKTPHSREQQQPSSKKRKRVDDQSHEN